MPRVSVDVTHPAVTAARRHSGKAAMERETPPTQTSPPHLAKAISASARSAGLAHSGASLAARTDAASARSSSNMGSASVSGSNLNPLVGVADVAIPPLSDVDEHFENNSVRVKMLHRFKAGKQNLCGRNLLFRWKSETANFQLFWYKFPGVRRMSDLPSGSNQIKHMKKPYIASHWAKENPV